MAIRVLNPRPTGHFGGRYQLDVRRVGHRTACVQVLCGSVALQVSGSWLPVSSPRAAGPGRNGTYHFHKNAQCIRNLNLFLLMTKQKGRY